MDQRRKMLQALKALKIFFANFGCNINFGFPTHMAQLVNYITKFSQGKLKQTPHQEYSFAIKMFEKISKNQLSSGLYDFLKDTPSLNPLALTQLCYKIKKEGLTLRKLITSEKEVWDRLCSFLTEQQIVNIFLLNRNVRIFCIVASTSICQMSKKF